MAGMPLVMHSSKLLSVDSLVLVGEQSLKAFMALVVCRAFLSMDSLVFCEVSFWLKALPHSLHL